jgi:hypothetical protein
MLHYESIDDKESKEFIVSEHRYYVSDVVFVLTVFTLIGIVL